MTLAVGSSPSSYLQSSLERTDISSIRPDAFAGEAPVGQLEGPGCQVASAGVAVMVCAPFTGPFAPAVLGVGAFLTGATIGYLGVKAWDAISGPPSEAQPWIHESSMPGDRANSGPQAQAPAQPNTADPQPQCGPGPSAPPRDSVQFTSRTQGQIALSQEMEGASHTLAIGFQGTDAQRVDQARALLQRFIDGYQRDMQSLGQLSADTTTLREQVKQIAMQRLGSLIDNCFPNMLDLLAEQQVLGRLEAILNALSAL